ncbi:hypothetical protein VKT23_007522 [Stygiomarasmius scandens]|uniref:Proteophosphoglycan 5 n=1 Tax=Marasmiellus scandens TaxID=2682957 RepID=A0ABR1JLA7_9AGAR
MILVHKPIPITAAQFSHRRHPSAPPASAVQRTPGLITLNKPLPKHQQPQKRQLPKPKKLEPAPKRPEPVAAKTPEKRGRQPKPSKPTNRSSSHSSARRARQASPPLLAPSQAEVDHSPVRKSNLFDPFSDDRPIRPAPTLASRPSGRLARRRTANPNPTPANTPASTPPRPIPVPRRSNSSSPAISRSVPIIHSRNPTSDIFPICDDLDEDESSFPSTPSRPPRSAKHYDDGPRTAPITSSSVSFPFAGSPSPAARKARKHQRVPSEGVFAMSSDDESSASDPAAELKAFFGLFPGGRQTTTSFPDSEKERQIAAAAAAAAMPPGTFFAGSAFQSSPSPEDLPPPSFV